MDLSRSCLSKRNSRPNCRTCESLQKSSGAYASVCRRILQVSERGIVKSRRVFEDRKYGIWRNTSRKLVKMGATPPLLSSWLPLPILSDSYKASHYLQYPPSKKMVAYGEFRSGFDRDTEDTRIVWYGMRYILETHVARQWTEQDVERADAFYSRFLAPMQGRHPYPKDLFLKFIRENNGYMPIKLEALPEGTCIHARCPVFQITATEEYSRLCTFLETLLVQTWYQTTVATLSRRAKAIIADAFDISVDEGRANPLLNSRLHDFGFRGCTCVEQSVLGGVAHLLNFDGTDTMSAAYYATFALNDGRPIGSSIPATEHSVMTAWPTEKDAISNMIAKFGQGGIFATVMDSYDYQKALESVVPSVAPELIDAQGFWVLRPDSGDPCDAVVAGLKAAEAAFGADTNIKGYKIPRGAGVIQGDGICIQTISRIVNAVHEAGYSIQSVAFGMGGGLLQKVNRDTMSFAVKLCHRVAEDGEAFDVMKMPKDDIGKESLPGVLAVKRVQDDRTGALVPTVFPSEEVSDEENLLRVVYNQGPPETGFEWESFDALRERVETEWNALPPTANVISDSLHAKIKLLRSKYK